jgi:uncharacterized repeat protein (TIGR01451 family)
MSNQDSRASVSDGRGPTKKKEHHAMGLLRFGHPRRAVRILGSWLAAGVLIGSQLAVPLAVPVAQAAPVAPAAAAAAAPVPAALVNPTNTIDVSVISARTEPKALGGAGVTKGDAIPKFKYVINIDNTGTTTQRSADPGSGCSTQDAGYPDSCKWVSIAGVPGSSPIYTQGTQADFPLVDMPNGRYLISVIADGFKLDGASFTIPMESPGVVTVELQPTPLPTATIRARVFEDNDPVNGAPDEPGENGLAGFKARLMDYIGEVSTDVFGNPLCSTYVTDTNGNVVLDADLAPTLLQQGHGCYSDPNGDIVIPNMGTNRYAMSVTPPIGSGWVQTTTLEGNHDWDTWVMEGATGFDTEFVVAGEPFPPVIFGFVKPTNTMAAGSGVIKGSVMATKAYIPPTGGISTEGGIFGGKIAGPIVKPWIALSDLNGGDVAVYVGQGGADGTFDIHNVPDGSYTLTYWDEPQDYILGIENVTVVGGETVDMGELHALGWWTQISGYVFNDLNENGKKDAGEAGLANFPVSMKKRENSLMDRGAVTVFTDSQGYYFMENAYPITQWLVEEVYSDQFKTTGVTYQADNQPSETTVLGAGVDISVLPIIGLGGRVDWGVKAYAPGENGGIVGTVSYDTTRNELDPRYAAVEAWQPGVPDLTVDLYAPVDCGTNTGAPCSADGYELVASGPDAGAYATGKLLNTYVTENWQRPTGCTARNVDGNPLVHGTDEDVLPLQADAPCLEGPLMGVQFAPYATDQGTPDANFGATVDGNYGFGDGCFGPGGFDTVAQACADGTAPTALTPADYLVKVEIPNDASGRPMYTVTKEEDINIFHGDQFVPQVPPPACAGPLHTVDLAGKGIDGYGPVTIDGVTVNASTPVDNPDYADAGGTYFEGKQTPLCDTKLVTVSDRRSIAPTFNVFTDVPLPVRFWGLAVDDLNFSSDPKSLLYGEKMGIPFAPVGIYDYTNRLVTTTESDYNGLFDVLLPSTNRISCPTPSGVCPNLYRFVGNDPGVPGRLNPTYNPQYRTIAAEFEAFPGLLVPADLAPTQVGVSVQLPGSQTLAPVACNVNDPTGAAAAMTPELFAVSKPYGNVTSAPVSFTIFGQGFGAAQGSGSVTLGGAALTITAWTDRQIDATVPSTFTGGPQQLLVTASNGRRTVNGLTFHVIKTTGPQNQRYNPTVLEVGPNVANPRYRPTDSLPAAASHAIQNALDDAPAGALVVVYPNNPSTDPRFNPRGAYYENLIISKRIRLQGVGPGGVRPDNSTVQGTILDGSAYGGDSPVAADWVTKIDSLTWDGNQAVNDGAVISLYLQNSGLTTALSIDGFDIRGGDQTGFPTNINEVGGTPTGLPATIVTQGGAIFANAYASNLRITNNVVQNNGGGYGTIRIGTPDLPAADGNQHNENVKILNNRVIANAGTNLAGGIGLFANSDSYEVASNDICGNFSAEYGGGLSAYGLSPNGKIHDNRIYLNRSYDEGGGVMIAGALAADPTQNYGTTNGAKGSGPVDIYNNLIQANLGNDDGGGIRFLMAGNFPMNVYNNMIVNNVSTHEGGGVALDDAPNVRFVNNTVMKNITTATAVTSDGQPAPAGLSTGQNSAQLQATLPSGSPLFSDPLLFNDIFWDNRAGARGTNAVTGIGAAGDANPINNWDIGILGGGLLSPTNTVLQVATGTNASLTNLVGVDPLVAQAIDIALFFTSWRTNINFIGAIMVTADLPPNLLSDYHLRAASPAVDRGAASKAAVTAPATDIDNQPRPAPVDIGADEIPTASVDLAITKTDGATSVIAGGPVKYTITITNLSNIAVTGAPVTDSLPGMLGGVTWTCSATSGSSCTAGGSGNNRTGSVTLAGGGVATYTAAAAVSPVATGTLSNTATVNAATDTNTANNSATDIDTIDVPLRPTPGLLDNFNRANSGTGPAGGLGGNWRQPDNNLHLNSNQALATGPGVAIWNVPTAGFASSQGAVFTIANGTNAGDSLILKATGGTAAAPQNYVRVRTAPSQVVVEYTINGGSTFPNAGILNNANSNFANGDVLTAQVTATGQVGVWRTRGAVNAFVGYVQLPNVPLWTTGGGRIGLRLLNGARVDDFRGGTLP